MHIERLIKMANDISNYFNSDPDKTTAIEGMKNHLLRTWEPRMRLAIIEYNQNDGSELSDLAKAAVAKL
ncbi:MAG: formate dehydrogenase subunit delta [Methylococcaceae bacterium]